MAFEEKMELISYGYMDDRLIGDAKLKCDCGRLFERDTLDGESDSGEVVECPNCLQKCRFSVKIQYIFEKL